ncbi:UbiD family decarboxylase [Micromonospora fulviviridis]|uniref:Pyrrole-2-carboxylic acid decarboxylase n=1 Tax=Micromonospora fulviviridis TaxID=47860 RepID=A0ABV2VVX8_9ACTN
MNAPRLHSLREYIDTLAGLGDVQEWAHEVDLNLEVGAAIRHCYDTKAPAPLFTRIHGQDNGFRILGAPGALSSVSGAPFARVALSLGLPFSSSGPEIVRALADARSVTPIAPVVVDSGPCHENVLLGDAADLTQLPVPLLHDGDGGPYINTWGTIIVSTPDGRWTNWSIARIMRLDRNRMTGILHFRQHLGQIYRMWVDQGKPMPFALVQGAEPAVPFVAGMALPDGTDEVGFLGGYFGQAQSLVRCRTVDLHVPANAEIVIEGHVAVGETALEGPMGEYTGYISGSPRPLPVYHVTAITHRDQAILPVVVAGEPVEETQTASGIMASAELLHQLRQTDLPVTDVWYSLESALHLLVVTVPRDWSERTRFTSEQLTRAVADVVSGSKAGMWASRVLLLDDDVDPTDANEVMWAFATRAHPVERQHVVDVKPIVPLMLGYSAAERQAAAGPMKTYDCLLPTDNSRPRRTAFTHNYPFEIQRRVIEGARRASVNVGSASDSPR